MNRTPLQLLIVEDEAAHVEAIRRAFDQGSFKTDLQVVGTLREYRERIAAQLPDLALVDLNFPDGRATELLTHPAADAPFPILVMTAFGSHQTVVEVMKAGALDYVVKSPEAFAAMPQTVTRALREWQLLQNQKQGETALRAREHAYATLVKNISGAVYRCRNDADWTVDFISDGCFAITGYHADELTGNRVTSLGALMHPDDVAPVWEKCQANLAAHHACSNEYRLTHRNGEIRWVWDQAQGIYAESGELLSIEGLLTDITARKQAEAALRASEAAARDAAHRQTAILNALPAHIALIDPEGVILSINEAWRRFATANFLQSADCCVGRNYLSVCEKATGECSNEAHEVVLGLREVLAGRKQEFAIEYPCHSPTEKRWFRLMVTPLHEDRREGAVVMHIDITERKVAEEAVLASEVRYRRLFESAKDGILILDAETGMVVDVNPFLMELLGFSREDFLGKEIWELGFLKDIIANEANFAELQQNEYIRYDDLALETRDGRRIEVEFVSNVYLVNGRKVTQCNIRDISERKRAEAAMHESEERFRAIFERAAVGVAQVAPDGRWLDANQQLCEIVGYTREELLSGTFQAITHPDDLEADLGYVRRVLAGEIQSYFMEKRYVRKDGTLVWIHLTVSLVREAAGAPKYFISVVQDISLRKRAEAGLRESEERLRLAVQASNVGLWDWDLRSNQVVFSREWKLQLGFEEHEIANEFSEWERRVHPEDLASTMACVRRVLAGPGDEHEVEFRMRHKDGSWRWIYTRGEVSRDEKGQPVRMLGCHVDITERQRGEAVLRKLARRLLRAEDDERRRIAKELHDSTAQELVAVILNLGTLRETLPALATESAQIIEDSVALLESSANDVRTLSYILHPPRLDETGLPGALTEYAAGLGRRAGIRLGVEVAPDFGRLPDDMEIALFRVAQESLGNVVRHSGSDRATLRLAREEGSVVIEIGDFGHGMPPEMLEQTGVRGVGIAGMRERLQYLGGRLEIASGSGGTTVRAVLPWKGHPK